MALQKYSAYYSQDPVTYGWTALNNVLSIQFSIGRQAQLDQVKSGVGTIEMRNLTPSPANNLIPGTYIKIENNTGVGTAKIVFVGFVSDCTARYGIPYVSGVGQADTLSISIEGGFARFGRMQGNSYSMAADTLANQLTAANTQTGLTLSWTGTSTSPAMAATTVSGTWGDWVARTCQSTNARLREFGNATTIVSPFNSNVSTINFSDTANNSTNQVYNQITFDSLADNYYTQVTVTPESYTAATVTKSGATTPYRSYQTNTLNASTSQATDYANYLLGNYSSASSTISSFTCSAEAQSSFQLDNIGSSSSIIQSAGTQVSVAFRGTTYQCIIEGVTVTATPASASYTYFVSSADLNAYLLLDNATFGRLDYNKLGY